MPRRINKTISLDWQTLASFGDLFPDLNFSQWVEDQMKAFIKGKQPKPVSTAKQPKSGEWETLATQQEREDRAFIQGVEAYLAKGESVPQATLDEYHRLKEKYQDGE